MEGVVEKTITVDGPTIRQHSAPPPPILGLKQLLFFINEGGFGETPPKFSQTQKVRDEKLLEAVAAATPLLKRIATALETLSSTVDPPEDPHNRTIRITAQTTVSNGVFDPLKVLVEDPTHQTSKI
uniref:Uncharacterized protein n=1 Tax=Soybean thrips permutotetra-like virus 1 TaxID=2802956 RepID=A0A7T8JI81_9VIRU|nr:hypothetical protein 2 [Soybean thrips permutotetra-like virus 1]